MSAGAVGGGIRAFPPVPGHTPLPQHAKEVAKQANLYRASAGARPNQTLCTPMTLEHFRHARWDLAEAMT